MTDAREQYPNGNAAKGNDLHPGGELVESVKRETAIESADVNPQPAVELPFTDQYYPFSAAAQPAAAATANAGPPEPAAVALDPHQLAFLAKLDAMQRNPISAATDASQQEPAVEPAPVAPPPFVPLPPVAPPPAGVPPPPSQLASPGEPPKGISNTVFAFLMIGIILGVLFGIAIAAITRHDSKSEPPPEPVAAPEPAVSHELRDLGSVDASDAGLSGHLTTKWDGRLDYQFVIVPDNPAQQADFALMVNDPPRPLGVTVTLKNPQGFSLCSMDILLRYDPRKAALAASKAKSRGGNASSDEENHGAGAEPTDSDETARENGKQIFQVQTGPNGQVASLSSQGELPCPMDSYANFAYWSFTADFPSVAEQDQLLQEKADASRPPLGSRKKAKTDVDENPASVSMAGDDAIVGYDPSTGNVETGAGKIFQIDRTSAEAKSIAGRDFPLNFHYSCEQATCTLSHRGAVLAHARMKR